MKKQQRSDMDVIYACCAGLDVHKKVVVACVRKFDATGKIFSEVRSFNTFTQGLLALSDWLHQENVTHVAMESTGVFWKPIWNILEAKDFTLFLVNAQHIKNVKGRKTDVKDAEWIAQLLQFGLLKGSFIPSESLRELRDYTRSRTTLVRQKASQLNRIQKVLEDANIKLGSVLTEVMGVSGRAILQALVKGEQKPEVLVQLAHWRLKDKVPDLLLALEGRIKPHHCFLLDRLIQQVIFLESEIDVFTRRIEATLGLVKEEAPKGNGKKRREKKAIQETETILPAVKTDVAVTTRRAMAAPLDPGLLSYEKAVVLLDTIPGIDEGAAIDILAEIGTDMEQFPSEDHLVSWAAVCPGNHESAGKRKSGRTRKGNPWLKGRLTQAAWGATRAKPNYLSARYHRFKGRMGKKRAILAVAHSMLMMIYNILKDQVPYEELGADYFEKRNREGIMKNHVKKLERMGFQVTLTELPTAA